MRKILIGLGALVVLIVAAALIAPFLIPTDAYVTRIAATVKQATGRDLKIDGPVSFHLLPAIALTANSVSLSGSTGGDFLSIGKLDVGLKLMPLLSHKVEIDHLTLDQPIIHLAVNKAGDPNWRFQKQGAAPAPAASATPAQNPAPIQSQLQQFGLGTIRITDGTLTYEDARSGKTQSVSKLDLAFSLPSVAGKLSLKISADWNGKNIDASVTLDNLQDALDGKGSALNVKIDAPVTTGHSSAIAAKGTLAIKGTAVSLNEATLSFDAVKATGSIAIDSGGARPSIRGTLDLGAVDLNPFAPAPAAASAAPPAAPTTPNTGWSDAPIDAAALKAIDADLALSLTSLKFHTIDIGKTALNFVLSNGRADIMFKQLSLYGGAGAGRIALDGSNPGIGMAVTFALTNVQMQPLLTAAMGMDKVSGTGTVTLSLTGAGRSQAQLMGTLGGKGTLKLANGAIRGIDLVAIEHKPLQGLAEAGSTAQTAFTALTGSFTMAAGVMSNQDLVLDAPSLTLTGKGTIDLYHRTINYRVEPALPGGIQGGKSGIYGTAVPIVISGPWSAITYTPDVAAIVQQRAGQEISKQLDKLGGNSKAGAVLKGLFGH